MNQQNTKDYITNTGDALLAARAWEARVTARIIATAPLGATFLNGSLFTLNLIEKLNVPIYLAIPGGAITGGAGLVIVANYYEHRNGDGFKNNISKLALALYIGAIVAVTGLAEVAIDPIARAWVHATAKVLILGLDISVMLAVAIRNEAAVTAENDRRERLEQAEAEQRNDDREWSRNEDRKSRLRADRLAEKVALADAARDSVPVVPVQAAQVPEQEVEYPASAVTKIEKVRYLIFEGKTNKEICNLIPGDGSYVRRIRRELEKEL